MSNFVPTSRATRTVNAAQGNAMFGTLKTIFNFFAWAVTDHLIPFH